MKSPSQLPAAIELFALRGNYILRIHDMTLQPVALKIAAALPADAETLIVITPKDTKAFTLTGTDPDDSEIESDQAADADPGLARTPTLRPDGAEPSPNDDPMEAAMALANQAEADANPASTSGRKVRKKVPINPNAQDEQDGRKPNVVRTRAKRPEHQIADNTPNSACGRCGGAGTVPVVNGNNEADVASCPVCKGTGEIRKFGARRGR